MIITIKEVNEELKEDGSPKHIEWVASGADGRDIKVKVYPSIKQGEEWIHFEDRWGEFLGAKNKTYDIERASIKVERGYWKPVIKATEVKDIMVKEAHKQVVDEANIIRDRSVCVSYSKDLVVADKIPITELITQADKIYTYITGGDDEALQVHKAIAPDVKPEATKEVVADAVRPTVVAEPIDMDWLHTSLKELRWTSVVKDMKAKYEIGEGKTVREVLEFMNELQKADFVKEVKESLSMGPPF